MKAIALTILAAALLGACGNRASGQADNASGKAPAAPIATVNFNADSAYRYVERQLAFGPRVPGSPAHEACGSWLAEKLRAYGAEVTVQEATLRAFDGTPLPARNIFARYNPQAADRILLLAHWDTRPWADNDPDPANHHTPVPGADDGASGVAVLLEIARNLQAANSQKGVDILFVDAEDYGTEGDDESWALGTRYFVNHPPVAGYSPKWAVLLDMVGGEGSVFTLEYFSARYAPTLQQQLWDAAAAAGASDFFLRTEGPAVTDDHIELIKGGIPAVDIIGTSRSGSFPSHWHTPGDDISHISTATLGAVGRTVMHWLENE